MRKNYIILFLLLLLSISSFSQEKIRIWENEDAVSDNCAKLLVYPASPENNNSAAVIICPGGSYHHLGVPHEGKKTAEWFNEQGVSAFVLCYRVSSRGYHHPAMIEDFQRAMQIVKEHANDYSIDTTKIGTIGFSAGGHLVLMSGALGKHNYLNDIGLKTSVGLRPNWVAAIYPVVSMQDSLAHKRSRESLLGEDFTKEQIDNFSMEMQIPDDMPPVFLQASKDDDVVDVRNSIVLDKVLDKKNINHSFWLYETGGHGYGMEEVKCPELLQWKENLSNWLKSIGMIP